jgi:two-component system alkaline phosphatase synthesis response regulator PhoP
MVLIVDDDPDFVAAVGALLEAGGYATRSASSGAEGLTLARSLLPDLVLLDVVMAEPTEGFTTLREMRAIPALAKTPVAIISSIYPSTEAPVQASPAAGRVAADLYLGKPVAPRRLLAEATRLTGGPSA